MPLNDPVARLRNASNLDHLADLFVRGQHPFPNDLPDAQCEHLAVLIRAGLRQRLLRLVASAIADDLRRDLSKKEFEFVPKQI